MAKPVAGKKVFNRYGYKLLLAALWALILALCIRNRRSFTTDGILGCSPQDPVVAAAFMLFLFALKSVSVFIYSGFLFTASGVLFPLPAAILLNTAGACIMVSIPYWLGRQFGQKAIDRIVAQYPKAAALRRLRMQHEFILSFVTRAVNILPSDLLSLYMGAMGIRYAQYLPGSILGIAMSIVTFPIMGVNMTDPKSPAFLGALAAQAAASVIVLLCYCACRKKKGKGM